MKGKHRHVVLKPEKEKKEKLRHMNHQLYRKRASFTRPFLHCEESPLCNLIDIQHAAMHLHTENKCDTIVTWRDAQQFQIRTPAPMPKRRLPAP